jgi:platelet-activating factor acetylhydrolase
LRTLSRLSPFGALLSRTLPEYSGKHNVGVFDIEVPVKEPKNVGSFVLKDIPDSEPGFKLESAFHMEPLVTHS